MSEPANLSYRRFVPVEGVGAVHYVAAGQGYPLVLVHGLAASAVAWRRNIPVFSRRYAVYAPDLPGHGDSAKPRVAYDLEAGLRFLFGFLDALGLRRVVLVGNSTGGLLALAAAQRQPERVEALVLVAPAGLDRGLAWALRLVSLPGVGSLMDALDVWTGLRLGPKLFHHPDRVEPFVHQELERLRRLPEVRRSVLSALRHGVNLRGLRSSLLLLHHSPVAFPVPTLLVWGQNDRVIPVRHAYRVAHRAANVQVRVFPDCGHWPQMEQADAFNEAVLAFLEGVVGAQGP